MQFYPDCADALSPHIILATFRDMRWILARFSLEISPFLRDLYCRGRRPGLRIVITMTNQRDGALLEMETTWALYLRRSFTTNLDLGLRVR